MTLSADPQEDKARKAAAVLALLAAIGMGRSQHNPQSWAIRKGGGGGITTLEPLSMVAGSWLGGGPPPIGQITINGGDSILTPDYRAIASGVSTAGGGREVSHQHSMPSDGKCNLLLVQMESSPGAGKSWTFTVRKNGVATALTCTISNTETSASDLVHDFDYVAGDLLSIRITSVGAPVGHRTFWSLQLTDSAPNRCVILGSGAVWKSVSQGHHPIMGARWNSANTADEWDCWGIVPTDGTFKEMRAQQENASTHSWTHYLAVNGANSALGVVIGAGQSQGTDLVHEVAVVAGDRVSRQSEHHVSEGTNACTRHSLVFVPDIPGEAILLGGSKEDLHRTLSRMNMICPPDQSRDWGGYRQQLIGECKLSKLHMRLNGSPGGGKSYTFTIMKGANPTALECVVSGGAVAASDTAHEVEFSGNDLIQLRCTPSGSPTARHAHWGLVQTK